MRVLIVEDQELTLEALESAATRVFPQFYPGFSGESYDVAKWYTQAHDMISRNQPPYDLILLDHRMPYDDPRCTDESDFDRFSSQLRNIGYGLIGQIKQKNQGTVVVGTSSMDEDELRGMPKPDHMIEKSGDEEKELKMLMGKIMGDII